MLRLSARLNQNSRARYSTHVLSTQFENLYQVARVLAAKTALSIRMDALGETDGVTIGVDNHAKVLPCSHNE